MAWLGERDFAASRLAQRLTGQAWKALESLNRSEREKFSGRDGLQKYLKFLEDTIMDLPIPELANRFME